MKVITVTEANDKVSLFMLDMVNLIIYCQTS